MWRSVVKNNLNNLGSVNPDKMLSKKRKQMLLLGGFGARVDHPEADAVHQVKVDSIRGHEGEGESDARGAERGGGIH